MKEAGYEWNADKKELKRIEPKPAWSEEDEHRLKDTIYFLDTAKKHYASTVELDSCIDWLKSLRGRYIWKPNNEQISILEFIMEDIEKDSIRYAVLNSVLEQLKKLKG